jgi:hypothetical protein
MKGAVARSARVWAPLLAAWLSGCARQPVKEAYLPDPGSVDFDISQLPDAKGSQRWAATYTSQAKVARFIIELGMAEAAKGPEAKSLDLKIGAGSLVAVEGSDASAMLADLTRALEAKHPPATTARLARIPFLFAIIGGHQSQAAGGGSEPKESFLLMKLFFGEGENESEVYLNLNWALGKGQFSIKDDSYGDRVLSELAKVL